MTNSLRRWVWAPAVALLALVLIAPHALANGQNGYWTRNAAWDGPGLGDCYDGNQIGPWYRAVCFKEAGDYFVLRHVPTGVDYWAGVIWRAPASAKKGICRWEGNGDAACNYQFYENSMVYYRAAECWRHRNGHRVDCTNVKNWFARSDEVARFNDH